jgi:hypothetical protein
MGTLSMLVLGTLPQVQGQVLLLNLVHKEAPIIIRQDRELIQETLLNILI